PQGEAMDPTSLAKGAQRTGWRTLASAPLLTLLGSLVALIDRKASHAFFLALGLSALVGIPAHVRGIHAIRGASRPAAIAVGLGVLGSVLGLLAYSLGFFFFRGGGSPGGRPLRLQGRTRRTPVCDGTAWCRDVVVDAGSLATDERIARATRWIGEARGEH